MSRTHHPNRFQLDALEPRILLAADGLSGAAAAGGVASAIEVFAEPAETARNGETDFRMTGTIEERSIYSARAQLDDIFGSGNALDAREIHLDAPASKTGVEAETRQASDADA